MTERHDGPPHEGRATGMQRQHANVGRDGLAVDLDPQSLRDTLEAAMAIRAGRPQLDCSEELKTCRILNLYDREMACDPVAAFKTKPG